MATNLDAAGTPTRSRHDPPRFPLAPVLAIVFSVVWGLAAVLLGLGTMRQEAATKGSTVTTAPAAAQATSMPSMPGMNASAAPAAPAGFDIAQQAATLPPPITRTVPTTVSYELTTSEVVAKLADGVTYTYWTFDNKVPGPFLRVMQGDTVNITVKNMPGSTMPHSIDLHSVTGPGGGSVATQTQSGQSTTFSFKALNPGLFIYHCATPPVYMHVADGMFGMILVEPPGGLPKVDHEFYVMQSELYTDLALGAKGAARFSNDKALAETPTYYVFNGRVGALTGPGALQVKTGETARIYFGVGTFKSSAFHVIGAVFNNVYTDGGLGGAVEHNVGVVNVPAAGTTIVESTFLVPGTYTIVDHALQRVVEGAAGQIVVTGPANPAIFNGQASGPMVH